MIESEEERGVPPERAERIVWATVNKRKSRDQYAPDSLLRTAILAGEF